MLSRNKLIELYRETSKHSNYQVLANTLEGLIGHQNIDVTSRHERERLVYLLDNLNIKGKEVLDIGGNTGFFTFELLSNGASAVNYYEGNKAHAEFVNEALNLLNIKDKVIVHNEYYLFDEVYRNKYDVTLLLNVLHHVGDDYGDSSLAIENTLGIITKSIQSLASKTKYLVFQMGFNWKGDVKYPLFDGGTKQEVIDFVRGAAKDYFDIISVGVAEKNDAGVVYHFLNDININRDDELGEFLNRPIFIMKSKV